MQWCVWMCGYSVKDGQVRGSTESTPSSPLPTTVADMKSGDHEISGPLKSSGNFHTLSPTSTLVHEMISLFIFSAWMLEICLRFYCINVSSICIVIHWLVLTEETQAPPFKNLYNNTVITMYGARWLLDLWRGPLCKLYKCLTILL